MKPFLILLCVLFTSKFHAQTDTIQPKKAYGFWFLPSKKSDVYGLSLGLVGSEAYCYQPYTKNTHGINIQLGQGFFTLFYVGHIKYFQQSNPDSLYTYRSNENYIRARHNGILISAFGTWTPITNGISISALASTGGRMNGLAFNLIVSQYANVKGVSIAGINEALSVKGVQIGIYNKAYHLKGFQFGLWNVNDKRRLPFINWSFK